MTDTPLLIETDGSVLTATLNRPEAKNALTGEMIAALNTLIAGLNRDSAVRILVLRGAGGVFCAGGDVKSFRDFFQMDDSPESRAKVAAHNRAFGDVLLGLNRLPQVVVAAVEGAAIAGGMGLVSVSDVAIATADAKFALTETALGIPPAQIAPFVVQRLGLTQARRLMLTGARFDGAEAARLGLVHFAEPDLAALDARLAAVLADARRCGPTANAATKAILFNALAGDLPTALDEAAAAFAACILGPEGREGVMSFATKKAPSWAEGDTP